MTAIIQTHDLGRVFHAGSSDVHAVRDVSFDVQEGRFTAIIGRSGAGKTTLLNLIAGLEKPTSGNAIVDGSDIHALPEGERFTFRREKIGFIFQNFGLLPLLSAAENISVPLRMRRMPARERDKRVEEALDWVGLSKRANHRPYELSGGEQQRVAVARVLAARPKLILADEPTGQLDLQTGRRIIEAMRNLTAELGITLLVVTHDQQVMKAADTVYEMHDGVITPA
ncbi:MAG: ABC transporter ATP-binding protein [Anaerolineae bacterium]|nr:ABC transporter ATP-binding protein [Anaerolineae bacterium]MCA9891924.1 ABC transporter ATP-binding protein [Anaerolineae bacterium]